jgi:hypothetical protein
MATPTIRIPDEFQLGTRLRRLVDQASRWVEDQYPELPFVLTAEWSVTDDDTVTFRLSDGVSTRMISFQPDELESWAKFQRRLSSLFQAVNGDTMRALSIRLQPVPTGGR